MVKDQLITEHYSIYNSDCVYVMQTFPAESIDLSGYSPPFAGMYNYSSSDNDHSNCETKEQFLQMYEFVVKEIGRLTKPGRITAVHVTNIKDSKTGSMWNLPNEVVKLHERYGFDWKDQITIWKEPLKVRMRTMVRSLMHKLIVEDSTECFTAMPDYIMVFKKKGINAVPVTHPVGLSHYAGETPILPDMLEKYGTYEQLKAKYKGWQDPKTNKLAHVIWQRYASSVWDDIRIDEVLQLQLDVIDRCVELWSNPGEIVLTPYMGVGSEVFSPVRLSRKGIGIELKESYYKQSIKNLKQLNNKLQKAEQLF